MAPGTSPAGPFAGDAVDQAHLSPQGSTSGSLGGAALHVSKQAVPPPTRSAAASPATSKLSTERWFKSSVLFFMGLRLDEGGCTSVDAAGFGAGGKALV